MRLLSVFPIKILEEEDQRFEKICEETAETEE